SKHVSDFPAVAKIDIVHVNAFRDARNVRALDPRIVIIVKIVEDREVVTLSQQPFDKMRANKPRSTGDQNPHATGTSTTKDTKCTNKICLFPAFVLFVVKCYARSC